MAPEILTQSPGDGGETGGPERLDVLIVGAGLSGIGAAHHLQSQRPNDS